MPSNIISLTNITKSFGERENQNLQLVLNNLNLQVTLGDSLTIMGPSGSGKSTLLKILGNLDRPDSGEYQFLEKQPLKMNEKEISIFRNKEIGYIFQDAMMLPQLTIFENILLPTLPNQQKIERQERRQFALSLIEEFGLKNVMQKFPSEVSGGEKQRGAIIRAMINKPTLLLADEPTGALDIKNSDQFGQLLKQIQLRHNITLILVTHSQRLADQVGNIVKLENGKLVQ